MGVAISFHSILVFSKIRNCYFLPFSLHFPSTFKSLKNKEWKEMAISKLHIKNIKKRKNLEAYLGTYGKTFGNIFHIF